MKIKKNKNQTKSNKPINAKEPTKIIIVDVNTTGKPDINYMEFTPESILCNYDPEPANRKNTEQRWTFETNSEEYRKQFYYVVELLEELCEADDSEAIIPAGAKHIEVIYKNSPKLERCYFAPDSFYEKVFEEMVKLLPQSMDIPNALLIQEDFGVLEAISPKTAIWAHRGSISAEEKVIAKLIGRLSFLVENEPDRKFSPDEIEKIAEEILK